MLFLDLIDSEFSFTDDSRHHSNMPWPQVYVEGMFLLFSPSFQRTILIIFVFQMLMDPMGGIVMTNDGNAILREVSDPTSTSCCGPLCLSGVSFGRLWWSILQPNPWLKLPALKMKKLAMAPRLSLSWVSIHDVQGSLYRSSDGMGECTSLNTWNTESVIWSSGPANHGIIRPLELTPLSHTFCRESFL